MSTVTLDNKTILVTGVAGFIGSNLVKRIYQEAPSATVIGIDNMNAYYNVALKEFRLNELAKYPTFTFVKGNIADKALITELFEKYKPSVVVNLAAQAGVRYSITNPDAYVESNLVGFFNILEACRHCESLEHLVYASSSSVYGSNKKVPYSTDDKVDNPVSLYAATKKSNELMAHAYSKLYNIPSTGLRFFTVYGPAGRPDMAYFGFTNKLVKGETIKIFNYGNCKRDFTYVDDIVEGVVRVMKKAPDKKNGEDGLPIMIWATINMLPSFKTTTWRVNYTDENAKYKLGSYYTWIAREHCLVMTGYDNYYYYFNDPWTNARTRYSKSVVNSRYAELGKQAVIMVKK